LQRRVPHYVPHALKTVDICAAAIEGAPWALEFVPKALKTVELCAAAVSKDREALQFVPEAIKRAVMASMV